MEVLSAKYDNFAQAYQALIAIMAEHRGKFSYRSLSRLLKSCSASRKTY